MIPVLVVGRNNCSNASIGPAGPDRSHRHGLGEDCWAGGPLFALFLREVYVHLRKNEAIEVPGQIDVAGGGQRMQAPYS